MDIIEREQIDHRGISLLSGAHNTLVPEIIRMVRERGIRDVLCLFGRHHPQQDITVMLEACVHGVSGRSRSTVVTTFAFERPPKSNGQNDARYRNAQAWQACWRRRWQTIQSRAAKGTGNRSRTPVRRMKMRRGLDCCCLFDPARPAAGGKPGRLGSVNAAWSVMPRFPPERIKIGAPLAQKRQPRNKTPASSLPLRAERRRVPAAQIEVMSMEGILSGVKVLGIEQQVAGRFVR